MTAGACIRARMGEAERAAECLDDAAKSVIMDSLFTTHNDWRNMGITVQWDGVHSDIRIMWVARCMRIWRPSERTARQQPLSVETSPSRSGQRNPGCTQ